MPNRWTTNAYWEPKLEYDYDISDRLDVSWLEPKRKAIIARYESFMKSQKECAAAKDYEMAKWFGQEVKEAKRWYTAIQYIMGLCLCDPPGDARKVQSVTEFPIELEYELDMLLFEWDEWNEEKSGCRSYE